MENAEALFNKLKNASPVFVSKEIVHQHLNGLHTKSFIVRDPDGHAMLIKEYMPQFSRWIGIGIKEVMEISIIYEN